MSAVQFHCPLCEGLFQVDDSLAGVEVNCPHCQGLVRVPDFSGPPAPPSGAAMELSCPVCIGLFQVLADFAGQQVHCPHCQHIVTVPDLSETNAGGFAPPVSPPSSYGSPPPEPFLPPVSTPTTSGVVEPKDLYPPGYERVPAVAPAPVESRDLYPPGYQPQRIQQLLPEREPPAQRHHESPLTDPLLPPGAGGAATKPQEGDGLLPPAAAAETTRPIERKPLPAVLPRRSKEEILIPTQRGYIGIHEPVKTIQHRGEEVELRKLTPEEKARRRLVRNTILFAFCVITLIVVTAIFMWK